jgi:hypothetical protein
MDTGEFVKSNLDLTRALEIEPGMTLFILLVVVFIFVPKVFLLENKSIKASVARLKKLEALQDKKDKARFKNLFEKLHDEDEAQSASSATA